MQVQLGSSEQPKVMLKGWDWLSDKEPSPGDLVRLRLYWEIPKRISEDLRGFVHLYTPATKKSWVIGRYRNPARTPPNKWVPGFYYVEDVELSLPRDIPPLSYTIATGMVDVNGKRLAVPGNPDGMVLLDEIRVHPLKARQGRLLKPSVIAEAAFGAKLRLRGYDLLPDPGGPILRLYWETLSPVEQDLVVFIHLLDPHGALIAQYDSLPFDSLYNTSQWEQKTILADTRKLWLPDNLPSGEYTLLIGFSDPNTGHRLTVHPTPNSASRFEGDALLATFVVP